MSDIVFRSICLASQSPRRQELLTQLGVEFECRPADIDESVLPSELPSEYVNRVTRAKVEAAWQQSEFNRTVPVLGSDTAVVYDSNILGKPTSQQDAAEMLRMLSGRTHDVITGVGIGFNERFDYREVISRVTFAELSSQDIEIYWQTGEGLDKAAGYAIQGLGASFITRVEGSFSGVVGLPVYETSQMLMDWKIKFWRMGE